MAYKLDNGHYPSRDAFRSDLELMINNAKTYNAPNSVVYQEAEKLKGFFEKGAYYLKVHGTASHFAASPIIAWDQVNSTLAAMGRNKAADTPKSQLAGAPSAAALDTLTIGLLGQAETAPVGQPVIPIGSGDPVSQGPDIALPATSTPMGEAREEASMADTPMVTPSPSKPSLKFKSPKAKPKTGSLVAPVNGDANKELEALLPPVPGTEAAHTKNAAGDADLLLGELVDEIGVDTKPRGTPSWSSKKKGKDRADGQGRRLVPESPLRQGSPVVPAISPVKPPPKKVSSSSAAKTRDPMADTHPIDLKRCNEIIKNLTDINTLPEVGWFLLPVDPIASGCPT